MKNFAELVAQQHGSMLTPKGSRLTDIGWASTIKDAAESNYYARYVRDNRHDRLLCLVEIAALCQRAAEDLKLLEDSP